ncbi:MAG: Fe-S cluster assembly protein SufD [Acetobacteraceae bacterium]
MSVTMRQGADSFLARYEGLRTRLPGDAQVREEAAAAFRRDGLPSVREEAWKYTSLRPIAEASFREPLTSVDSRGARLPAIPALDGPRLVFVDGRWREDLSRLPELVAFTPFALNSAFGTLPRPERDSIVALNTMLAEDGAMLSVAAGVDAGMLVLVNLAAETEGRQIAFHPRHAIHLAEGARLTVVELALGRGAYLHNPVTEIAVAANATLTHIRLQDEAPGAFHLATIYAEVQAGGFYDAFTLTLGGRVSRAEFHARLAGEGAVVHLHAAQMLSGNQLADITTVVQHDAPGCSSRQAVKNVLSGRSRGVFQGRIEVARAAQKTDGYQMSQALLLSPDAEIDCKPELQIYADDVKCSHGATIGELDADQLFYLRARGVPEAEARALLIRAFLDDALEAVTNEPARALLEKAVEGWRAQQAA